MVRVSNGLIAVLNAITLALSIAILGAGIWLSVRGSTDCEKFLDRPAIAVGAFLLVVSVAGLVGACCRVSWLLWLYLLVTFVLIVLLLCFTVFAFVVTNRGAGEVVSGRGYREYRLGDYSNWLRRRVNDAGNWGRIRSCIRESKICESFGKKHRNLSQFVVHNLSPVQSGCCKPPSECNFRFAGGTTWIKPDNFSSNVSDCHTWENDPKVLCFDCGSCKAGVLANLKNEWKKVAVVNLLFLIFLTAVYSVGCCAIRNNRRDDSNRSWKRSDP
ncbi:Tetraspanin-8 [Apostasia shenzhenica]|uniref:Tetraspanin-8 n=1 Tax=Apostasia shenzhenica TaxID=1088818 RepID=A0A2I0BGZ4_9ASPA|nr:Tetraspanin-8 [Apostasia shenzhenica]